MKKCEMVGIVETQGEIHTISFYKNEVIILGRNFDFGLKNAAICFYGRLFPVIHQHNSN